MARQWSGVGPEYLLDWGGRTWALSLDAECPGLRAREGGVGPLLGLEGIATTGRWSRGALSGRTLAGFEVRGGRVEATYDPEEWGPLTVRAAWSPAGADGLDLEVEIKAGAGNGLEGLEVKLVSALGGPIDAAARRDVWPRDAASAALSYDGREPEVEGLTTRPPGLLEGAIGRLGEAVGSNRSYVELARPGDVSRRIVPEAADRPTIRTALFGFDLEKGVVFRAKLRGLWIVAEEAEARYRAFLDEPPPLAT